MINNLYNQVVSAPLAGITNEPFRIVLKKLSAKITFTEMISAEGIVRKQDKTLEMLKIKQEPAIIIPQIFGSNPHILTEAAKVIYNMGFNFVDINMGCPVKKVTKKGAGVKLMEAPKKVAKTISSIKKLPIVVSAKIRIGTSRNNINYLEILKILYNEGIDFVTIHPRTGEEFFQNRAKWDYIKKAKDVFPNLFIIGNGDIATPEDIKQMFEKTGCNAVMVGRKLCENPFLIKQWLQFSQTNKYLNYNFNEKIKLFKTLLYLLLEFYNDKTALNLSKKYIIFFTKGIPESSKLRKNLSKIKNCIEILEQISYWFEKYNIKDKINE